MGRPIKKTFFGNLNNPDYGSVPRGSGVGGEGVSSVAMISTGSAYTSVPTVAFPTPQIGGGVAATGAAVMGLTTVSISPGFGGVGNTAQYHVGDLLTISGGTGTPATVRIVSTGTGGTHTATGVTIVTPGVYTAVPGSTATHAASTGSGAVFALTYKVSAINVTTPGSGYTSTGTLTISGNATARTFLSTTVTNAIAAYAHVEGTGAIGICDIIKQEASHRYLVQTTTGTSQCKLVASNTPAQKEMYIIATDTQGCTYWVTKLTARRAILTRRTSAGTGYQFATNAAAGWNITGAVAGKVSIAVTN